jgi:(1->4)-alpha-D-glucan 1-alpha-D-glucosylmutase
MTVPTATYRVQLRPGFGFDEVADLADHWSSLGVSHVYLSPILQAAPGSGHGYDVIDHDRINTELGGREAFERMSGVLSEHGLSVVVDVVPNHMAVPTPVRLNRALWSVLRDGPASPYARWFDVDWSAGNHAVLMPVLADRIGAVIAADELRVDRDGDEPVLRYWKHEFPIRPGTEDYPLPDLVEHQWYRLAWWRVADDELNYRRFFDVDTLAGLRVEDPEVFEATHHLLLDLVKRGYITGLRVDHPDGLADPRGYLNRLAEATDHLWIVVEKILQSDEQLPRDWACAGTTGYDSLRAVTGVFLDPAGAAPLGVLAAELTGENENFGDIVDRAKRDVMESGLYTEVHRLTDLAAEICRSDLALRDHTRRQLRECLVELLVGLDRYRAYVVPGEVAPSDSVRTIEAAADRARERLPGEAHATVDLIVDLVLGRPVGSAPPAPDQATVRRRFLLRFQQTCGSVMAKGVEDTAFYRYHRLICLNEVGGAPERFGITPEEFHAQAAALAQSWPTTMTALSTHDTKRSQDVRARLSVLSEIPSEWAEAVRGWTETAARHRSGDGWPDPATIYLIWQTLIGVWEGGPPATHRLQEFCTKATREAKEHTSWTDPNPEYDAAVAGYVAALLSDTDLMREVGTWCARLDGPSRTTVLGSTLLQLTMPGVPDVYQGCESICSALVDPDNRRPVDFADHRTRLARLDAGATPSTLAEEKLLVTSRALRLRRDHPHWFVPETGLSDAASDGPWSPGPVATAGYAPVATTTGHALAFARGPLALDGTLRARSVTVVTRLPVALDRHGGWAGHTLTLPEGSWRDVITGRTVSGGPCRLADLLDRFPVALLAADGSAP